jgi:glycosyltransferase involved in cell wall biosynthesis
VRVLHVINSLGASGGAEHGMVREITELSSSTENLVVRLYEKGQLDTVLESSGISVIALGLHARRGGKNWLIAVRRLGQVIRGYKPDVIHSSLFAANLVSQIGGRLTGVPVLSTFTLSGDSKLLKRYQPGGGSVRASILRKIAGTVARHSNVRFRALTNDALITNCRLLGVDTARAQVIPRGVPVPEKNIAPKTRQELGLPTGVPLIVNVGRQSAQKGHVDLLRAFRFVLPDRHSHLVIIGREGDASRIIRKTIEENQLEESVTLTGYTSDVVDYLRHGAVFAFTSHMEGLGTAMLEAMAVGLPIVAFDIPPVREITKDGAFATLVMPGDVDAFAAGLIGAIEGRGPSVSDGMKWVRDNYSVPVVASRLEALLRDTAASRIRA